MQRKNREMTRVQSVMKVVGETWLEDRVQHRVPERQRIWTNRMTVNILTQDEQQRREMEGRADERIHHEFDAQPHDRREQDLDRDVQDVEEPQVDDR